MVKKFPNKGRLPFKKGSGDSGDPRRFEGAPSTSFEGDNDRRNREPASVYDQLSQTNYRGNVPPGARLRPSPDNDPLECSPEINSENWVVDSQKMQFAQNDVLKDHNTLKSRQNHVPILQIFEEKKVGFGIQVRYHCGFKNCKYVSSMYELYQKTSTGQPTTNLQAAVAMAKTELTPKTVNLLGTTLNLASPSTTSFACYNAVLLFSHPVDI